MDDIQVDIEGVDDFEIATAPIYTEHTHSHLETTEAALKYRTVDRHAHFPLQKIKNTNIDNILSFCQ